MMLVASLGVASVGTLRADEATPPAGLRAATERAVARVVLTRQPRLVERERADLESRTRALRTDPVAGQAMGGGGIGKMLIVTLLTTAIGVGAYYLITKKSRDATKSLAGR
jgi:hypothetical protein